MSEAITCPYCEAGPGVRCKDVFGEPAQSMHVLRHYAAQRAGLEPRGYIPADQQQMLDDPQALERYRAARTVRRSSGAVFPPGPGDREGEQGDGEQAREHDRGT